MQNFELVIILILVVSVVVYILTSGKRNGAKTDDTGLNLILTQDLMEIFSRINKFLFPVRQIQIELERIWMRIPRRFKEAKHITTDPLELKELFVFERKIAATRSRISMVINNLWAYF